jgi:hypothetical protein
MILTLAAARQEATSHNWASSTASVSYLVKLQTGVYEIFFDREGKIASTGNDGFPILDI